jgi:hypothetical protein
MERPFIPSSVWYQWANSLGVTLYTGAWQILRYSSTAAQAVSKVHNRLHSATAWTLISTQKGWSALLPIPTTRRIAQNPEATVFTFALEQPCSP